MKNTSIALAGLALATLAPTAGAVGFTQNDITLDINGVVNGYFVNRESKATDAEGRTTKLTDSGISSGLLPGWINFVATTTAGGLDLKAHVSFAPGINSKSSIVGLPEGADPGSALSPYSQIDTRNAYFSFGSKTMGTVKIGRDIGLFGQNIILSDMTLMGVGGTSNASIPFNTTFGMIGHGYMYTGFQAQITYTTPNVGGLQGSIGIFQPSKFAGDETKTPGLQAMVSYDIAGSMPGKVWAGLVSQKTSCSTDSCSVEPFTANGFELGGKLGFGNAEVVAYGFQGKGLGISTVGAQFLGGSDGAGNRLDSRGYLLQGTYKIGATKVGLNYGQNRDRKGFLGDATIKNKSYTLGVYHSLNKFVTLVGEFNHEKITDPADAVYAPTVKNRTITLGGIMFF